MSFLSGLMLGLGLIIAIGAQNIWVLSQSMAGANRLVVAGVCIFCDAALIFTGVYGATELKTWLPELLPWFTWGGILMLGYLASSALIRAYKGTSGLMVQDAVAVKWWQTALAAFAICLLNPHVYLDTVLLLGSVGAVQPQPLLFAMGAGLGSVIWFSSLVLFSPKLRRFLSSPMRWRVFDGCIAAVLCFVAFRLYSFA